MTPALWLLRAGVLAALAALVWQLALWCGPDLELRLAPVLADQAITDVLRDEETREACFVWRFSKLRAARTLDANWTLRAEGRIYPYQAVRQDLDSLGDRSPGALIDRPPGPGQWTRKCIDTPPALVGRPFVITGFVEYATAATGAWWSLRQPTASARVP
ncbi:hypothetical protein OPKNFCMD_3814 [Methylobacterium crusticola]|uniref:DUF4131 domain-containing protein n=1 Tax=Methylobacterium crusticola TaxID=1697972 RepID=A0ABQ4R0J3_9HYPH|nr:hypothetical protein [Methylobacterium crusticola]GJD51063.1 hypothetical protein OPKNFCMD_3814 [Methylobacterium crusticola]